MIYLLCFTLLLRASALKKLRTEGPNDEVFQDYIEDFWELKTGQTMGTVRAEAKLSASENPCINKTRLSTPSKDDTDADARGCSQRAPSPPRDPNAPQCAHEYGTTLKTCDGSNCSFYWVEIPSSGSSTMEAMLHHYFDAGAPSLARSTDKEIAGLRSFALVRHPVARFIGAYDRMVQYVTKVPHYGPECMAPELKEVMSLPEPDRFQSFVRLFLKMGPSVVDLYPCPANPCLLFGLLSQIWFLNNWKGPLDFIGHMETFHEDVTKLSSLLGVELRVPMKKRRKATTRPLPNGDISMKGDRLVAGNRAGMEMLHLHFQHDMAELGYGPLEGFGF